MKHWDAIRIFYVVANCGSCTKAGEVLNISQAAISRTIRLLEDRLRVKLFNRLAQGMSLTPEGYILYEGARNAYSHLEKAGILLYESDTPQGVLTIGTAASTWLLPYLMGFSDRYPEIQIKIQEYQETVIQEDAHLPNVMIGSLSQLPKHWIHRPLMTLTFQLYASEQYLRDHGTPRDGSELSKHHLMLPTESLWPLLWQGEDKPEAQIYLSSLSDLRTLALWDYGLALLPDEIIPEGLVRVPVLTVPPTIALYYSYPEYLKASSRVTVLFEHLVDPM